MEHVHTQLYMSEPKKRKSFGDEGQFGSHHTHILSHIRSLVDFTLLAIQL